MKALTLWQPWATLVELGVKRIETRSWSTTYRGPLAIHAAKTRPKTHTMQVGDYRSTPIGDGRWGLTRIGEGPVGLLPFGAVIATCRLVDVVPMIGERQSTIDTPVGSWLFVPPDADHLVLERCDGYHLSDRPIVGERAYGDYTPGRYAWLLADVRPLAVQAPARGRQQLWEWDPEA